MQKIFAFLSILAFALLSEASVKVEYRVSKAHGLIDFVLAISGDPYHAPVFSELYKSSPHDNKSNQEKLKTLADLKPNLNQTLDYKSSVPSRRLGTNILNLILTQSLYSESIADLSQRTLGLIPVSDHQKFISILQHFEPVYEELVWKKNLAELKDHQKKLEALGKKLNLNEMFQRAETFYRVSWPKETPFVVGLYPVPFLKGVPNTPVSLSLGSVEVHGVRTGMKEEDINGSFAGIFHELCHSLYDAQSDADMKEFEEQFTKSRSPYKHHAYQWINEALATALANGWAFEQANNGKIDEGIWYNHPTINGFAKEIYPLVKQYIKSQKPIDAKFTSRVIDLYAKKYPESIYSFEDILTNLAFVHNSTVLKGSKARNILEKSFFVSNYSFNQPILKEGSIQSFKAHRSTGVLVFSDEEIGSLQKFSEEIPYLKSQLGTLSKMKNRSFFAGMDSESKAYIVIKSNSETDYQDAVEKMKSLGKFDPKTPIVSF